MTDPARGPKQRPAVVRRRIGHIMHVTATVGLLTALVGAVVGWQLIGRLDRAVTESTDITTRTFAALDDTILVAYALTGSVGDVLAETENTLDSVAEAFDGADGVVTEVSDVLDDVTPALSGASRTSRDLADVGRSIDSVLRQLDDIPFGPNYDPDQSLGEQFDALAEDLEPLASGLETTNTTLDDFLGDTDSLRKDLEALADSVGDVNTELTNARALLDDYAATTDDARELARTTSDGLGLNVWWARLLLVAGALVFAAMQLVPYWVGRELIDRSEPPDPRSWE